MKEKIIQSVDRAINILELFEEGSIELSVKEISTLLNLPKSTIHGLLKTLELRGYLVQNHENQKYRLGLKLFELGNLVAKQLDIKQVAFKIIEELARELKETIHLVILDENEVLYIEKVDGPGALRMYSQVGKRAPMYCTGVGKVILAFLEEEKIKSIIHSTNYTKFTSHTVTDPEELYKMLPGIREKGYAMDDEEIELGLRCIAAPIFNHENKVIASISCAGPKTRIIDDDVEEKITKVKKAASAISTQLGWRLQ
ncbi:IclR family transcriptional regulator [Actinomycetes bacterium NPDC127524]